MTPWPDADTHQLLALYDDGLSRPDIAATMNRPLGAVSDRLDWLGGCGFQSFWYRQKVAAHEAGHAVAVIMRGHRVTKVWAYPQARFSGRVEHDRLGRDGAFVAFAGLWAEARYAWEWDRIYEHDAATFNDYLTQQLTPETTGSSSDLREVFSITDRWRSKGQGAVMHALNTGKLSESDLKQLMADNAQKLTEVEVLEAKKRTEWDAELESLWPLIQEVADLLTVGKSVETISRVIEAYRDVSQSYKNL